MARANRKETPVPQRDSRICTALDLPVGHVTQESCQAFHAKIFLFRFSEINAYDPRIPARLQRGGRVVTDVEAGCDGREGIVRRAMRKRTAKACGPGAL